MRIYYPLRNSLAVMLAVLAPAAHAVGNGFYFGLGAGQSNVNAPSATINGQPSTANKTGVAERLFMGGQFNQYAAFEMGYIHFGPASYNVTPPGSGKPSVRINAVDMAFKGIWPFKSGWSVFGMPGFALARASESGNLSPTGGRGPTTTSLRPMLGFGVGYDINQSWVADLSYRRLFGSGVIYSSTVIMLSFSYHFVDEMCGEFLC